VLVKQALRGHRREAWKGVPSIVAVARHRETQKKVGTELTLVDLKGHSNHGGLKNRDDLRSLLVAK